MAALKILVVDDDELMVKTTCALLRAKGYHTEHAYSGAEAVEKVRAAPPDCVVMDIRMPGLDGIDAMKQMKADSSKEFPVILMSAYATEEQIKKAKRSSAFAVISKPLDLPTVLLLLTKIGNGR